MSPFAPEQVSNRDADRELFERLAGDPTVIGEIYDRYAKIVYAFCLKRCGHKETAEDITGQTFVKLLESAHTIEYRGTKISAWLFQVASNAIIDHYRKHSTKKEHVVDDPDVWEVPSDDDPAWNVELVLEGKALRAAMNELSERDQRVLSLRFFGGLEPREIAEELGVTPNLASVLVYRAIGRLRERVLKRRP